MGIRAAVTVKSKTIPESDDESYSPPEVGLSFAACHLLLSPEADGFQLLVESGSSNISLTEHWFVGLELESSNTLLQTPRTVLHNVLH